MTVDACSHINHITQSSNWVSSITFPYLPVLYQQQMLSLGNLSTHTSQIYHINYINSIAVSMLSITLHIILNMHKIVLEIFCKYKRINMSITYKLQSLLKFPSTFWCLTLYHQTNTNNQTRQTPNHNKNKANTSARILHHSYSQFLSTLSTTIFTHSHTPKNTIQKKYKDKHTFTNTLHIFLMPLGIESRRG